MKKLRLGNFYLHTENQHPQPTLYINSKAETID